MTPKEFKKRYGIDLETVIKAQTEGIYTLHFDHYEGKLSVYEPEKYKRRLLVDFKLNALIAEYHVYPFDYYGKTWALTEGELSKLPYEDRQEFVDEYEEEWRRG